EGARRIVLAGVVESRDERKRYEEALGVRLVVCRLRVRLPVVHERLARRHEGDEPGLRWHLGRSGELDRILDVPGPVGVTVDATERRVRDVAAAVLEAAGWRRGGRQGQTAGRRGWKSHASKREPSCLPDSRSASAVNGSVVALPCSCSAAQVRSSLKKVSSPISWRRACSVIAPRR